MNRKDDCVKHMTNDNVTDYFKVVLNFMHV